MYEVHDLRIARCADIAQRTADDFEHFAIVLAVMDGDQDDAAIGHQEKKQRFDLAIVDVVLPCKSGRSYFLSFRTSRNATMMMAEMYVRFCPASQCRDRLRVRCRTATGSDPASRGAVPSGFADMHVEPWSTSIGRRSALS